MNDFKTLFDGLSPSELQRERMLRRILKEKGDVIPMTQTHKAPKLRTVIVAAALAAALLLSVSAAVLLLSPREVADRLSDPALAAAFESPDAILINQSVESEGYRFTLAGLVSGQGLSDWAQDVDVAQTYAVASVARLDGTPMETAGDGLVLTPLVSGYEPRRVNAWTLGGGYSSFVQDGVVYYLFSCQSLELFADHTVYLAAYKGFAPGPDTFSMAEDGTISFTDGVSGPRALFTLPLDAAGADPAAAAALLEAIGIPALGDA